MYKIDRRGGRGGVHKSLSRTDPRKQPNIADSLIFIRRRDGDWGLVLEFSWLTVVFKKYLKGVFKNFRNDSLKFRIFIWLVNLPLKILMKPVVTPGNNNVHKQIRNLILTSKASFLSLKYFTTKFTEKTPDI